MKSASIGFILSLDMFKVTTGPVLTSPGSASLPGPGLEAILPICNHLNLELLITALELWTQFHLLSDVRVIGSFVGSM
ncbi:hypothetical protein INR49_001923 [Caranx melampygus]|nr:hypothetical protein INR49_001923 [Caranx melampygus]